jgi:hypothetical protein
VSGQGGGQGVAVGAPVMEAVILKFLRRWQIRGSHPFVGRNGATGTFRLTQNTRSQALAMCYFCLFSLLGLCSLWFVAIEEPQPIMVQLGVCGFYLSISILCGGCLACVLREYVELSSTGIERSLPFRAKQSIKWAEIRHIEFQMDDEFIKLRSRWGKPIKISVCLHGLGTLREILLQTVPTALWDEADELLAETVPAWIAADDF